MQTVRVNLGPRSYDIALTSTDPAGFAAFARRAAPKAKLALVVTDANVISHASTVASGLQSVGIHSQTAVVPAGEASKSVARLEALYDALAELPADRGTLVVAVGGGVVGDLGGFAAATYNRGLPLLMVPTTLLAMVDSSVGGKTGVNHPKGKNLIGSFHQPAGVWIDTAYLASLPDREFRSGLAEVVKYGVIQDPEFFEYLEANAAAILARRPDTLVHIVARSCRLKADVVEQDEREETGLRAILNYGHTFAHGYETVGGYGAWLHGEAVAAGMVGESRLAERLGRIPVAVTDRQVRLLTAFGLPIAGKPEWATEALIDVMRRDKKSQAGKLRFVLPTRLGHVELVDGVSEDLVREVLRT
ncbi:3-dehydroquinate synthase [Fimbriiglobus ruber]|uniref:3-dehydroquinate synthase n=1 Tax=Fimbriiglobus ruber TaxID=1908690 RepID=A0A225DZP8_9BACT|nr:3-dehydroquinate synthase [Fimbriiglobus ruber]OWK43236.1 3-dehydroquinate synthase [Fimbriiglobus ruber]